MKSPEQLAQKLARQWYNADTREKRLLEPECWPLVLSIGKPSAALIRQDPKNVRDHNSRWRGMKTGNVIWEKIKYRDALEAIELPVAWCLQKPSEWIEAAGKRSIKDEFRKLGEIVGAVDPVFHRLLVRQRHLIMEKTAAEVIQTCALALELERGCANGLPLRTLSNAGIDSKFFERHRNLIIKLLNVRFDGLIGEIGLETFLDALNESDHWLLLADLDGSRLPFKQIKVRSEDLKNAPLDANNILIVENERCLHLLPRSDDTIAILGAGMDLTWMEASWLNGKKIGYWGDIDTWGLTMLAGARRCQSDLTALMMNQTVFEKERSDKAVVEPVTAGDYPPDGLSAQESRLYICLLESENGRLEQEFLSPDLVAYTIQNWAGQQPG